MAGNKRAGMSASARSFLTAIVVIFELMVLTYVLTFVIPGGEYARTVDAAGNVIVDTAAGFRYVDGGLPFSKWLLSPFLVLGAEGSTAIIAVIIFLLVIGGIFSSLEKCDLLNYILDSIVHRFGRARYKLMYAMIFFFMAMGAFIGSFEECVPLVPIVVALALELGWDALTGLGMSLIAVGCGFASGVMNPFTVGVAQSLSGLPMFSGVWLRIVSFVLIYLLLTLFIRTHAKKVDTKSGGGVVNSIFERSERMSRALICFASILGAGILIVVASPFIKAIQDYTMIIVAVAFLAAGLVSVRVAGLSWGDLGKSFLSGVLGILPGVAMILMASSIKYTLVEAHILDTILYGAVGLASTMPRAVVILFIYLIVLVMNFFIASGSAKAFLLIPLIVPIAQIFGISPQLCILAYAYGDGFSNVFYPTNPVLLISLGLADVNYGSYAKWSWKFQILNLLLTSGILLFGLAIGYR